MLLDFSLSKLFVSASVMDTLLGQVANALAVQIELNLHLNTAVNFVVGCGFLPLLGYRESLLLLFIDPGVQDLQIGY